MYVNIYLVVCVLVAIHSFFVMNTYNLLMLKQRWNRIWKKLALHAASNHDFIPSGWKFVADFAFPSDLAFKIWHSNSYSLPLCISFNVMEINNYFSNQIQFRKWELTSICNNKKSLFEEKKTHREFSGYYMINVNGNRHIHWKMIALM